MTAITACSTDSYFSNVAAATRALAAAIFAYGKMPAPAAPEPQVAAKQRVSQIRQLFSMASQYEDIAPSLSSELRYFAGKL